MYLARIFKILNLSDFLGAREPIRNATGCPTFPTLVIFAVAGAGRRKFPLLSNFQKLLKIGKLQLLHKLQIVNFPLTPHSTRPSPVTQWNTIHNLIMPPKLATSKSWGRADKDHLANLICRSLRHWGPLPRKLQGSACGAFLPPQVEEFSPQL